MTLRGRLLAVALLTLAVGIGVPARHREHRPRAEHPGRDLQRDARQRGCPDLGAHHHADERPGPRDGERRRPGPAAPGCSTATASSSAPRTRVPSSTASPPGSAACAGPRSRRGPTTCACARCRSAPPASRQPVGSVVVAYSTSSVENLQHTVLIGSFTLAALVLLAGAIVIRSALDGALRPVAQMTASAREWSAHDLDRRFDLGPARDELTSLAATLDGLLARIAASRRHEQRFAAEVAHELRTPLTAPAAAGRARARGRPGRRRGAHRGAARRSSGRPSASARRSTRCWRWRATRSTRPAAASTSRRSRGSWRTSTRWSPPPACHARRAIPRSCAARSCRSSRTRGATRAGA